MSVVAVVNSGTPAGVDLRPNRSRSQLATNDILVSLGRVFGRVSFSSRDVSDRFGLDFLYTAKVLCRMSKRPYYLLSVVTRVPGLWVASRTGTRFHSEAGTELTTCKTDLRLKEQNPVSSNLVKQGWAAHYLLNGYGKKNEMESGVCFKTTHESSSVQVATHRDHLRRHRNVASLPRPSTSPGGNGMEWVCEVASG